MGCCWAVGELPGPAAARRGREAAGAGELEEAVEKLLLPLLLLQLLSQEQQAETALAGSSVRCPGRIRPEEKPCLHRSQTPGHSEQPGCDQGRKRRRKGEDVAARPESSGRSQLQGSSGGLPPRWICALGSLRSPDASRPLETWAGLGKARLNRGQVAWPGPGQPAWKQL